MRDKHGPLREPRQGIMLHYDASGSDAGSVAWLQHPDARVSYNWVVLDNGNIEEFAPFDRAAWHAGVCRPSHGKFTYRHANSAFWGVALAAKQGDAVTREQMDILCELCASLCLTQGWGEHDLWRITGHADEAWPRGRKSDPYPLFDVATVRSRVAKILRQTL